MCWPTIKRFRVSKFRTINFFFILLHTQPYNWKLKSIIICFQKSRQSVWICHLFYENQVFNFKKHINSFSHYHPKLKQKITVITYDLHNLNFHRYKKSSVQFGIKKGLYYSPMTTCTRWLEIPQLAEHDARTVMKKRGSSLQRHTF